MPTIKLTIEYDGTAYAGWQRQPNQATIQGKIENALNCITRQSPSVIGAGRTDAGVHANGQVASFITRSSLPDPQWTRAINRYLPHDISILHSERVENTFHAQRSAKEKLYEYRIHLHSSRPALDYFRVWHLPRTLEIPAMQDAAATILGTHDFASFQGPRPSTSNTFCTISGCSFDLTDSILRIHIQGDRFLKQMVRNLVGTFVEIGQGKRSPGSISDILQARNRQAAGITAPPQGLYLQKVFY